MAKTGLNGVVLECLRCGKPCLLPYTDDTRESVEITSIEGWTAPPLRCPDCSQGPLGVIGTGR